ncbi:DoxX-like family protein [Frankia tisae]|uniref:DoxX-like family protein n=1 Tax=Frankia tisae TaxID=2950104 RepID=UPI0021BE7326|nr:DoxX-like family protein [Frankia tisae]
MCPAAWSDQAVQTGLTWVRRLSPAALLAALGLVYLWFGALKLAGVSPAEDLLGRAPPWFDQDLTVYTLGGVEIVIGLALLSRRSRPLALLAMVAHLVGTFLMFVTAPSVMVRHGNPFLLTAGLVLLGLEHPGGRTAIQPVNEPPAPTPPSPPHRRGGPSDDASVDTVRPQDYAIVAVVA